MVRGLLAMHRTYEVMKVNQSDSQHLLLCSALLFRRGIPNRVYEKGNSLVLLVFDEDHQGIARQVFEQVESQDLSTAPPITELYPLSLEGKRIWRSLLSAKITSLLMGLSLIVALYTYLGVMNVSIFVLLADINASSTAQNLWQVLPWHEAWRFISPAFLHMGWLHLSFNLLWLWYFGSRLEVRVAQFTYLLLILSIIVISNLAQYWAVAGEIAFGGLSGLVYGLLGFCWWYDRVHSSQVFQIPPMLVVLMLLWLILCALDAAVVDVFQVANTAHVAGLLSGMGLTYIIPVKRASAALKRNDKTL